MSLSNSSPCSQIDPHKEHLCLCIATPQSERPRPVRAAKIPLASLSESLPLGQFLDPLDRTHAVELRQVDVQTDRTIGGPFLERPLLSVDSCNRDCHTLGSVRPKSVRSWKDQTC